MQIRKALPDEAAALSDLAFRSKAYWPYDKNLLEDYKDELEVFKEDIQTGSVFVIESATTPSEIAGFYSLSNEHEKQRLYFLFVEPTKIGQGYGKALWQHALKTAKEKGWSSLTFYADTYATEAFYKYQNCQQVGTLETKLGKLIELKFILK